VDGGGFPEVQRSYLRGGSFPEPQIVWVSPWKTLAVADHFAKQVVQTYVLHHLLSASKLPLDELAAAQLVAMEMPSKAATGFEHLLLRLVQKVLALGPQVALMVLPAARQQAHSMMWVNRWNHLDATPFSAQAVTQLLHGSRTRRRASHIHLLGPVIWERR